MPAGVLADERAATVREQEFEASGGSGVLGVAFGVPDEQRMEALTLVRERLVGRSDIGIAP